MALVVTNEEKSRRSSFRAEKKPWMLRDYLRDDMSSCSSNGFRSFPRKQCCVAVKNIIENEVIRNGRPSPKPPKALRNRNRNRNRNVSSALQRASMAVINAVKLLPFNSITASNNGNGNGNSNGNGGSGLRFLPRSFSKKLFKRSFFWKKSSVVKNDVVVVEKRSNVDDYCDEIERWISSGIVATEKYEPLDLSNETSVTNASTTSNSNSNTSNDGKSSDSWSDITFTSDYLTSLSENDAVKRKEKVVGKNGGEEEEVVSQSVGVLAGDDSSDEPAVVKDTWCNDKAETEHLSPISVMDFPCSDDGSASPFTLRMSRLKGTKERLLEKLGRFESLAAGIGLDPVNLETLMSSTNMEDHSARHSIQSRSSPSYILSSQTESEEEEESQEEDREKRVQNLLDIIKLKKASYKLEHHNLLLSFFRDNVVDHKKDDSLLKSAENWLDGHYDTLILGWEVKHKRQAYIRDMEERGRWPKDCKLETEEVADEFGDEVLATLMEEVVLELC
ncbi:uncharacterized protein LOC141587293 [Silene latifolia]|uniref:uncharacterized protein LOC141587293 n=1 Tax=Silene latifolia TaxID=37657 RepID=UPI003D76E478